MPPPIPREGNVAPNLTNAKVVIDRRCQVEGETMEPGRIYDGPHTKYLVFGVKRAHPFDKRKERIVVNAHGHRVAVPALQQADVEVDDSDVGRDDVPNESWTVAKIREWLVDRDPAIKVPTNASKQMLLEACQELRDLDPQDD